MAELPCTHDAGCAAVGEVAEWKKAVGDTVVADEEVCELETDKVHTQHADPPGHVSA